MKFSSILCTFLPLLALVSAEEPRLIANTEHRSSTRGGGRRGGGSRTLQSGKGGKGSSTGGKGGATKGSSGGKAGGGGGNGKGSSKSKLGKGGGSGPPPMNPALTPPAPTPSPVAPLLGTTPAPTAPATNTIVDFVISRPDLTGLLTALGRAGFIDPLSGDGPFTLFAPTNAAFNAVPDFFLQLLFINDEFIPHLQNLLAYTLVAGEANSVQLIALAGTDILSVGALSTEEVLIQASPLRVNGIPLAEVDNDVDNGIVHIIEEVLAPSWIFNTLTSRISDDAELSILFSLLGTAGIDLTVNGAFTLLAPIDAAWNDLGQTAIDFLLNPDNANELTQILAYHIVNGVFATGRLATGLALPTNLGDTTVAVTINSSLLFNTAAATAFDILATNGVLHKINQVLNPADSPATGP